VSSGHIGHITRSYNRRPTPDPSRQGGERLRDATFFQDFQDVLSRIKVEDACEVGGVADVHGIGDGLYGRAWTVVAALQVLVEDAVGVVGSDEALDGQAHDMPEEGGAEVAEIAGGDTDD